jgi:D-alanyl-D-alanine carboxypeptidase (penicillin-binding protein 5/6)
VTARAYVVENGASGAVLASYRAGAELPIASITKLMTVLVTLEHASPADVVTVTADAAATGEESIYLRTGERLTVGELVKAALIQSANDAAVALADHVGGTQSAFVVLMNRKARQLGLLHTHFVNPDGLDAAGHYSSARDVTLLARIAMRNPLIRQTVDETDDVAAGRTLHTWNDLLSTFPGVFGVKTGHTGAAGWSQVAAARGRYATIYATLLGGASRSGRNSDLAALLAWGLSRYRALPVISATRVYATATAPYGRAPLALKARSAAVEILRVDRTLRERVVAPAAVSLPVARGQALGRVEIWTGKRLVVSRPLVAARAIARPGWLGRSEWYAGRAAHAVAGWFS